ncbi:hypothetical protein EI067_29045 [Mycobacterium paragordonae]|nr:hypothetical protein EI067_29045 [Mycobacterium paragordonae]
MAVAARAAGYTARTAHRGPRSRLELHSVYDGAGGLGGDGGRGGNMGVAARSNVAGDGRAGGSGVTGGAAGLTGNGGAVATAATAVRRARGQACRLRSPASTATGEPA